MTDVLFYEDGIIFDSDDPDFMSEEGSSFECDKESNVLRESFSADCLPKMSYDLIDAPDFGYPSNGWLLRGESVESLDDFRMDNIRYRIDPNYYGHINECSMTLEDLKTHFKSCNSCGVSWSDNHVSLDCSECGGYSLTRPCPMCDGECKSEWTRDVIMSHSVGKAHWEGQCHLSKDDLQSVPSFLAEDILIQGIEELSTSS